MHDLREQPGTPSHRVVAVLLTALAAVAAACSATPAAQGPNGRVRIVAAENEYANVAAQVGGKYVTVAAVMSNPNTDPHDFESSPQVAQEVAGAQIVIQNGLGYDTFMDSIESASPDSDRKVVDVQELLSLPGSTANPHLWYGAATMPAVAKAIGADLSKLQPAHSAYFRANVTAFDASLAPWTETVAHFRALEPKTPVAVTEPVADYLLEAMGMQIETPWQLQADIMNGVDPAPENVTLEEGLLAQHRVKVFVYNEQVTDPLTQSLLSTAERAHVPVVGVYETMPTPGFTYQSWMVAEAADIQAAVLQGTSTQRL